MIKKFIAIENSPDEILELAKIFINKNILGKFEMNSLFEEFDNLRKTLDKLMINKALINNSSTNHRLYDCKQKLLL